MPRNETVINVFVASPSDVSEERKALESIVQELNKTWSNHLKLRLDLIKWETDVYPGFGDSPQDVINKQINDEYDIFIAIFWGKIGSPTQSAESGTIEEFDRAYKRFVEDESSVDIMVYFKDEAISPSKMDFEQLRKVQKFKNKLGEKGGLYWTFDNTVEFEYKLRFHLSKIAQKWSEKAVIDIEQEPEQTSGEELDKGRSEDGYYAILDYLEVYKERMSTTLAAISSITKATEQMGRQAAQRTKEINSINEGKKVSAYVNQASEIIMRISIDMKKYSEIIESQIKIASKSREEAFDVLSKVLSIHVDFKGAGTSDIVGLAKSVETMIGGADHALEGLSALRESFLKIPPKTIQLSKSKRRVARALDDVLEEIENTVLSANYVLKIIKELK